MGVISIKGVNMEKLIDKGNLVEFDNQEHSIALKIKTNKYFNLFSNTDLFCKVLEEHEFKDLDVDPNDFKTYVIDGKLFIGIDIIDDFENDTHHYLYDAYNVYSAINNFAYYRKCKVLTKAWRKSLKSTYADTTYPEDLKKVLKKELKEIVDKFNDDNVDLL